MKKLNINGKNIEATDNSTLKEILENEGLSFPCDGKGICGRCKIICSELEISEKDKIFFSAEELQKGCRLACDKKIIKNLNIVFEKSRKSQPAKKLEECNIIAVLDYERAIIGIVNDSIQDIVEINSFSYDKSGLISVVGKNAIDFFEKYGLAKADTIAISTNRNFIETMFGKNIDDKGEILEAEKYYLPAENLYILPFEDEFSATFISRAIEEDSSRIIIFADNIFLAGLSLEEDFLCLSHKNVDYSEKYQLLAIKTSIEFLLENTERPPIISISGRYAEKIATIFDKYTYIIEDEMPLEIIKDICNKRKYRNKIMNQRKKISVIETVENDRWQEIFNLLANTVDK